MWKIKEAINMGKHKNLLTSGLLSFQHVLAMFGATVLVPYITGLNPSIALLGAGGGTLIFHLVTGGQVPAFLGSSFAFLSGILVVKELFGMEYATGSFIAVGAVYFIMAAVAYFIGAEKIRKVFPPIVTGPIIMVIGLILAPVAVDMASTNWTVAIITILTIALTGIIAKGFVRMIPIIVGIIVGYISAIALNLVDFTPVLEASWFYSFEDFTGMMIAPKFSKQ